NCCLVTQTYKLMPRKFFEHLPRSIAQLGALENLDLSDCKRLTQLPEDIGCLSSLKKLYLNGNNFEHLPQSISELGALRLLELSDCKKLTQLPGFPQQLDTIAVDWSNDSFCNSLFQNISSLQHDICSSHSLSLRVFSRLGNGEQNQEIHERTWVLNIVGVVDVVNREGTHQAATIQ
ncbi:hypothetical protein H5410_054375, partial [Solanum commersonii]